MLSAPNKKLFLWIGGLEAVSQLLGFIGASKLPGQHHPRSTSSVPSAPKLKAGTTFTCCETGNAKGIWIIASVKFGSCFLPASSGSFLAHFHFGVIKGFGVSAGVVLPLLQQSTLLWQVGLAYLVLNKRLEPVQARPFPRPVPVFVMSRPSCQSTRSAAFHEPLQQV